MNKLTNIEQATVKAVLAEVLKSTEEHADDMIHLTPAQKKIIQKAVRYDTDLTGKSK